MKDNYKLLNLVVDYEKICKGKKERDFKAIIPPVHSKALLVMN